MAKKHGRRGEFLSCLRYPDCKGTLELTVQPAPPAQEAEPQLAIDQEAIGCLIVAAGLCANADTEKWNPDDIAATALNVTRATLNHLKDRRESERATPIQNQ